MFPVDTCSLDVVPMRDHSSASALQDLFAALLGPIALARSDADTEPTPDPVAEGVAP